MRQWLRRWAGLLRGRWRWDPDSVDAAVRLTALEACGDVTPDRRALLPTRPVVALHPRLPRVGRGRIRWEDADGEVLARVSWSGPGRPGS